MNGPIAHHGVICQTLALVRMPAVYLLPLVYHLREEVHASHSRSIQVSAPFIIAIFNRDSQVTSLRSGVRGPRLAGLAKDK
jgi:hypothetical protein